MLVQNFTANSSDSKDLVDKLCKSALHEEELEIKTENIKWI